MQSLNAQRPNAMPIKNVLVVDDSPTDRQHLTDILAKGGYNVSTAASAEEGIAKAKQTHPDLVLMDVVLPGHNGYQATRELSKDEATKNIPAILATSKTQEADKVEGMRQRSKD